MSLGTSVLVGQSGGPTAAINASLAGVVVAARTAGFHAVGMRYGIQGLLDGRTVDLDEQLAGPAQLELLSHTPSSYLGSCRYKLPDPSADETPYRTLFKLRLQNPEIARGEYSSLNLEGTNVGGFIASYNESLCMVLHNTTNKTVTVDLSEVGEGHFTKLAAVIGVTSLEDPAETGISGKSPVRTF